MPPQFNSAPLSESPNNPVTAESGNTPIQVQRFQSVGTKINIGYALALGVAVLGTTIGLSLGSRSYEQARYQMDVADDESELLSNLQGALLEIETHQRELILHLHHPQAFQKNHAELLEHLAETKQILVDLREFAHENQDQDIVTFIQKHSETVEAYSNQVTAQLQQIDTHNLQSTEIPQVRQLLLDTTIDAEAVQLDQFIHELINLAKAVRQKQAAADAAQSSATALQAQIIVVSIGLSVAIAAVLAFLTSRAISKPIEALTRVSQTVTAESNFDLQAPITTQDEIGILAVSFNQLIQQVKCLLEEQKVAIEREREMQEAKLIQSEKMSSLGRMLSGVAHEINNPVNFIYGNLSHASDYVQDLLALLQTCRAEIQPLPAAVQTQIEEIDLAFLEEDLPKVLQSMQLGADRIRQIVLSLKNFARLDDHELHPVDLRECLESTLLILNNRIKKEITIQGNYADLPTIEGFSGLLYQVFMNVLSNALDALEAAIDQPHKQITIAAERTDTNWVTIRIADNGMGIPLEVQSKIFDMFFTTKPKGIGTGMGLAISHQIIVEKHGGRLDCQSTPGVGTEFTIALPIQQQAIATATNSVAV